MLNLTPFHPSIDLYVRHDLHVSIHQGSTTSKEVAQLHAFSVKTATLNHPFVSSRLLALYADSTINNLDYARSVFNHVPEPTLFSWNTLIRSYVDNHQSHDALLLFDELLSSSPLLPDAFTLPCVIKGCARLGALDEGKQIHGLVLKIGYDLDTYVQSSLVAMYSKCRDVDSARRVFNKLENRDLVSWNTLMDGYVKCGNVEAALNLFNQMTERDAFSWTVLIDGLSKCGKIEEAREVFGGMRIKNLASWNSMINGYMRSGDSSSARTLFDQMEEKNIISWNSMIGGYESNGMYLEALELFVDLLNAGGNPSYPTLVSTLSAFSGLALLSKGQLLHSYLVKNGYKMDGVLGTSLIEMYSKCGSIENALAVFQKIRNKKLGHWTAIIAGLGMHGMANQAVELFFEMRMAGVAPNAITFIGVLNACNHGGLVDEGRHYFDMMVNEYAIVPMIEHYGCLVDILCRAGHLDEAKSTIQKMPMKPNEVIWMSLLSGARSHRNIEIGEYAAQNLIDLAPKMVQSYVLLSNMYAAVGRWDKVSQIRKLVKIKGVRKNPGWSCIEHNGMLHEFIVGDRSHCQSEQLYLKLREITDKLKHVGYVPDTTQVLLCVAEEEEKEAELEAHSERLAMAFGLINMKGRGPILILKNLRVCNDCHSFTKLLSKVYDREIIVRDTSRFHHFKNGSCSCKDYW